MYVAPYRETFSSIDAGHQVLIPLAWPPCKNNRISASVAAPTLYNQVTFFFSDDERLSL